MHGLVAIECAVSNSNGFRRSSDLESSFVVPKRAPLFKKVNIELSTILLWCLVGEILILFCGFIVVLWVNIVVKYSFTQHCGEGEGFSK